MIKNLNLTISFITLIVIVIFSIKLGVGTIFSSHREETNKGNWDLFKKYSQNIED